MIKPFKKFLFTILFLLFVIPVHAQSQATWTNPWSNKTVSIPNGWSIIPKDAQETEQQAFTFFDEQGNSFYVAGSESKASIKIFADNIIQNNAFEVKSTDIKQNDNVEEMIVDYHAYAIEPHDGTILFGHQDSLSWQVLTSTPLKSMSESSQKLAESIFESFAVSDTELRVIDLVQTWQNPWTFKSINIPQWWKVQNNISQCSVKLTSYLGSSICINIDKSKASAEQAAKAFASSKKMNFSQFQSGSIHGVSFYASPLTENDNTKISYFVGQIDEMIIFMTFSHSDKLDVNDTKKLTFLLSDIISTFVPTNLTPNEKAYSFDYNINNKCAISDNKLSLIGETENKNQGSLIITINNQEFNFQNQQAGYLWMNISGNVANIQKITRSDNNLSIQFIDQFSIPYSVTYNNLDNDCLNQLRAFFTKADIAQIDLGPPQVTNE